MRAQKTAAMVAFLSTYSGVTTVSFFHSTSVPTMNIPVAQSEAAKIIILGETPNHFQTNTSPKLPHYEN
jgi:hypothetical protein